MSRKCYGNQLINLWLQHPCCLLEFCSNSIHFLKFNILTKSLDININKKKSECTIVAHFWKKTSDKKYENSKLSNISIILNTFWDLMHCNGNVVSNSWQVMSGNNLAEISPKGKLSSTTCFWGRDRKSSEFFTKKFRVFWFLVHWLFNYTSTKFYQNFQRNFLVKFYRQWIQNKFWSTQDQQIYFFATHYHNSPPTTLFLRKGWNRFVIPTKNETF